MLCQFQLNNNINQLYVHTHPSLFSLPPTPTPHLSVITESQAELPLLYSRLPLAVCLTHSHVYIGVSLVAWIVKYLPAMWETWVPSLGQEDLLEKGMATHSSILAERMPWTEEHGRLLSMGSKRVGQD